MTEEVAVEKVKGRVKWFNPQKGYGFIVTEKKGPDVFVHYSAIEGDEKYKQLNEGDNVEFIIKKGPKGMQAEEVVVV